MVNDEDQETTPDSFCRRQAGCVSLWGTGCSLTQELVAVTWMWIHSTGTMVLWVWVSSIFGSFSLFLPCSMWLLIQGQHMLKVSFILMNHHRLINIVVFPSPEYSGLSDAFSNLITTTSSWTVMASVLTHWSMKVLLFQVSWLSACTFSGKDVAANNSFMVLFEQKLLKVYSYHRECTIVSRH